MSRFLILLLIALLPLRGWTAQRMVFAADHGAAVAAVRALQHGAMPADCALHGHAAAEHTAAKAKAAHPAQDHKGCESCQLCMPLAALDAPALPGMEPMPQAMPRSVGLAMASVDPARDVKPPIS